MANDNSKGSIEGENSVAEQLSCAVDGELDSEPSRFLLRRLQADSDLKDQWQRYHLISDCVRGQYSGQQVQGLASAVSQQIALESPPGHARFVAPTAIRKMLRPIAGLAVAASVAMVAVVGLRSQDPGVNPGLTPAPLAAPSSSLSGDVAQPASASTRRASIDAKLSRYLVRHNEMAPEGGRSGFVSYAHMVSNSAAPGATNAADADQLEGQLLTPESGIPEGDTIEAGVPNGQAKEVPSQ